MRTYRIITSILLLALLIWIYILKSTNAELNQEGIIEENTRSQLFENRMREVLNSKTNANLNSLFVSDGKDTILLNEVILKSSYSFLRIPELSCSECYYNEINLIRSFKKTHLDFKIFLLVSNSDMFNAIKFERINQNSMRIYYLLDNTLTPIDSLNVPYYGSFTNSHEVSRVFIPLRNCPDETHSYLSRILNTQK